LNVEIEQVLVGIVQAVHADSRHAGILHGRLSDCQASNASYSSNSTDAGGTHASHAYFLWSIDHESVIS
jgi:hypothetical protein